MNFNEFNVSIYNAECSYEDSPNDLPSTVMPLTHHDRQVEELQAAFSGQHLPDKEKDPDEKIYIWREADKYIKSWLNDNGYTVLESKILADCIGYRCNRQNYAYTIFMYAYGQRKTVQLNGNYCSKLLKEPFAENSKVLIVYFNVKRFVKGEKLESRVFNYCGSEDRDPEFWAVNYANEKPILEYYPRKEMVDLTYQLMYAFNHDNADVYENIIAYHNPSFIGPGDSGYSMNDAVVGCLRTIRKKYGIMKLGYVRYNDAVYSSVPYIDGYGCFSFRVNNADKIAEITAYGFDGGGRKVAEFIKTDLHEPDDLYDFIPQIINVSTLPSAPAERFAIKVTFDNGEIKKYVLPIDSNFEEDEAVEYKNHVFSDGIWKSAQIDLNGESNEGKLIRTGANRGAAICFSNGFYIPGMTCYLDGTDYSESV